MESLEKNTFSLLDEDGNEVVYDVLFTFEDGETGKAYIAYTDNSIDPETGSTEVFASVYYPEDGNGRLEPIETEEEWKAVETVLSTLQSAINQQIDSDD